MSAPAPDLQQLPNEQLEELHVDFDGKPVVRHRGTERVWIVLMIVMAVGFFFAGMILLASGTRSTLQEMRTPVRRGDRPINGEW